MRNGRTRQLLLIGLILLLGIQLTGLSCLDDWRIGAFGGVVLVHDLLSSPINGAGQPSDDGCPCHLSLAPVYQYPFQIGYPIQPHDPDLLASYTLTFASLTFHPPLLS